MEWYVGAMTFWWVVALGMYLKTDVVSRNPSAATPILARRVFSASMIVWGGILLVA